MISAILIFVLIVLAVLARRYIERDGGFVYCITGLFLTFVGSLNEAISYASQREQIFWLALVSFWPFSAFPWFCAATV